MEISNHRELCKRQHSILAAFAMHVCWKRGLNYIYVHRETLESFLGITKFKAERLSWIKEDIVPYFPFSQEFVELGRNDNSEKFTGAVWCQTETAVLPKHFSIKDVLFWNTEPVPSENELVHFLTKVAMGLYPKDGLAPSLLAKNK